MEPKFSQKVKEIITLAREEALRLGHDYIGTEHLILGMIRDGEGIALNLLRDSGVQLDELRITIEQATKGAVTRQALRPDDWQKIWPELIPAEQVKP